MFTGIVEEVGRVRAIRRGEHSAVLTVSAHRVLEDVHTGDSIAVNGICLTVTCYTGDSFTADVMHETIGRSAFAGLRVGAAVNLERAMSPVGRFGGHIVSGHIDGTARIKSIRKDGNAVWYTFLAEEKLLRYIVEKGSVAIDGISLTVAEVKADDFSVSVIPHTREMTALAERKAGEFVNIENDCIGKYVERLLGIQKETKKTLTKEQLYRLGF